MAKGNVNFTLEEVNEALGRSLGIEKSGVQYNLEKNEEGKTVAKNINLDGLITPGKYQIGVDADSKNGFPAGVGLPTSSGGILTVYQPKSYIVSQEFRTTNAGVIYYRSKNNSTWSPWTKTLNTYSSVALEEGGTGRKDWEGAGDNAFIIKEKGAKRLTYLNTTPGALYATANDKIKFGKIPFDYISPVRTSCISIGSSIKAYIEDLTKNSTTYTKINNGEGKYFNCFVSYDNDHKEKTRYYVSEGLILANVFYSEDAKTWEKYEYDSDKTYYKFNSETQLFAKVEEKSRDDFDNGFYYSYFNPTPKYIKFNDENNEEKIYYVYWNNSIDLVPNNALITKKSGYQSLNYISTKQGAFYATDRHGKADFGVLPLNCGGTGTASNLVEAGNYAIIRKGNNVNRLSYTNTNNGAFYATKENGEPQFGTLQIEQGGTGQTTRFTALISNDKIQDSSIASNNTLTSACCRIYDYLKMCFISFTMNYTHNAINTTTSIPMVWIRKTPLKASGALSCIVSEEKTSSTDGTQDIDGYINEYETTDNTDIFESDSFNEENDYEYMDSNELNETDDGDINDHTYEYDESTNEIELNENIDKLDGDSNTNAIEFIDAIDPEDEDINNISQDNTSDISTNQENQDIDPSTEGEISSGQIETDENADSSNLYNSENGENAQISNEILNSSNDDENNTNANDETDDSNLSEKEFIGSGDTDKDPEFENREDDNSSTDKEPISDSGDTDSEDNGNSGTNEEPISGSGSMTDNEGSSETSSSTDSAKTWIAQNSDCWFDKNSDGFIEIRIRNNSTFKQSKNYLIRVSGWIPLP